MADMQFPNVLLGPGTFNATLIDNNGSPSTVLEAAAPFTIQCAWTISPLAAQLLGGQWQVAAYVESMGPGPEQEVGPTVTIALNGGTNYSANIVVPANTLPDDPSSFTIVVFDGGKNRSPLTATTGSAPSSARSLRDTGLANDTGCVQRMEPVPPASFVTFAFVPGSAVTTNTSPVGSIARN